MTAGYYINCTTDPVSLTPVTSSTGYAYAVVDCSGGDAFTLTATGGGSPRAFCFVDENLHPLCTAKASTVYTNLLLIAPEGSAKLIINDRDGGTSYKGAPTRAVDAYAEELARDTGGLFKIFTRVGVIGDSLSVGTTQDPVDTTSWVLRGLRWSWVKQAGRDSGVPWLNFGQHGFNVLTWCSSSVYGKVQMEAEGNLCQAYIIGLGCNDEWNAGHHVDLGTTEDIVDDPDTVATTYYGGYNRIIQLLKRRNPLCKIFCLTNPMAVEEAGYNDAVRYIAETHYTPSDGVFLVEWAEAKAALQNPQFGLVHDQVGVHFSAVGYRIIATMLEGMIDKVMNKHRAQFMTVAWIPFDTGDPTPDTMTE